MPLLTVANVTQRFGGYVALDGVSCTVARRDIHALIGPNGAGKTTLFNIISGLLRPIKGTLSFGDRDYNGLRPDQILTMGIARNFQQVRLFPVLSIIENVMVGCYQKLPRMGLRDFILGPFGHDSVDVIARRRATEALAVVEFGGRTDVRPSQLTLVDQRRVEIARALVSDPQLLLLDEPAAGMNPSEAGQLGAILKKIQASGRTILIVEHNMRLVMGVADEITVLSAGKVIASGTPGVIQKDAAVISAYLGNV
jgi:ABC-type branched-subunit amino acid transport system ATPase component